MRFQIDLRCAALGAEVGVCGRGRARGLRARLHEIERDANHGNEAKNNWKQFFHEGAFFLLLGTAYLNDAISGSINS